MRTRKFAVVALVMLASIWTALQLGVASAADADQYVGTWNLI
jgi:hypothetical protein